MTTSIPISIAPKRILFTMLRVKDIEKSIAFYTNMLGMREIEREVHGCLHGVWR